MSSVSSPAQGEPSPSSFAGYCRGVAAFMPCDVRLFVGGTLTASRAALLSAQLKQRKDLVASSGTEAWNEGFLVIVCAAETVEHQELQQSLFNYVKLILQGERGVANLRLVLSPGQTLTLASVKKRPAPLNDEQLENALQFNRERKIFIVSENWIDVADLSIQALLNFSINEKLITTLKLKREETTPIKKIKKEKPKDWENPIVLNRNGVPILAGKPLTYWQWRVWKRRGSFACQEPQSAVVVASVEAEEKEFGGVPGEMETSPPETKKNASPPSPESISSDSFSEDEEAGAGPSLLSVDEQGQTPNEQIIAMLKQFEAVYAGLPGGEWRARAYRLAQGTLKNLPYQITQQSDLERPGLRLGIKTRQKIAEFMQHGNVTKLDLMQNSERFQTVQLFANVWGVGAITAEKFYNMGYRTLDDLRLNLSVLSANQQIGLQFYHEFQWKIPRDEVHAIIHKVKCAAKMIKANVSLMGAGSFRRGEPLCGDVDILIAKMDDSPPRSGELRILIEKLKEAKVLTHELVNLTDGSHTSDSCVTFMGVCKVNQFHRRIDIKMYGRDRFAFALLHFTGNSHFNRSMRLYAKKLGMSLTDRGLFRVARVGGETTQLSESIPCKTELEIFDALGLDFRYPWQRRVVGFAKKTLHRRV